MRKIFYLAVLSAIITGCSGLNRSILEPLDVKDLKQCMKADTTFTDKYSEIQELRSWIQESDVRQAKYGELTYKQVLKYERKLEDTTFCNKMWRQFEEEYKNAYPDYTEKVDSIAFYWKKFKEKYDLDSLVTIEFDRLWKEYYSYIGGVRQVNIGFLVTPLKGTIEQLTFRYQIKSKISNDGKIDIIRANRCLASSPISKPKTLYWEADYDDEDYLEDKSTEDVMRDYDFNIEVTEVRIGGHNMSEKLDSIPKYVRFYLDEGEEKASDNIWTSDVIKELINPDYKSEYEYIEPKYEEKIKELNPLYFELLKEYWDSED